MKGKIIKTEKELIKFLNNFGIARILKLAVSSLLLIKRTFKFHFNLGGDSFTDGVDVTIGVPKFCIGKTKEEILSILKAMTGHETEHMNSTPMNLYTEFIEKFGEYFNTKHGINELVAKKIGSHIINSVEDGRIERILVTIRAKGLLKPLILFRGLWWNDNETVEYDPSKMGYSESEHELFSTLFVYCTFATMGQYPKYYPTIFGDDLCNMMRSIKPEIFKAVNSDDFIEATNHIWESIYKIEDWLVEKMKDIADPEEFLKDFDSVRGGDFGKLSEGNTTTGAGSGSISSSPIAGGSGDCGDSGDSSTSKEEEEEDDDNPLHDAFDDKKDDSPLPEEEKEEKNFKATSDGHKTSKNAVDSGEYDSDERMDSIVRRAMREAEEEVIDAEGKNVAQADFDDMQERKRLEKEEKLSEGTTLDASELDDLENLYGELNKSWKIPVKFHRYKFDLLTTPPQIKLEAKKMSKEFMEIFINKSSIDSKNRKRGYLNTHDLWKLTIQDVNIFEKKGRPNRTDYVFYILIDGSGSMGTTKFKEAYRASASLEECLKNIAPLKIAQFDVNNKYVNHYIVKDFEDNKHDINYSFTFANNSYAQNCNMDGYSIRIATNELLKRSEKKKILIILSDGLPSGWSSYFDKPAEKDVKNAIREARKKHIDVFNIMFGSEYERTEMVSNFKYMYEKGIVSCAPEMICNTLLKIVKKELKR